MDVSISKALRDVNAVLHGNCVVQNANMTGEKSAFRRNNERDRAIQCRIHKILARINFDLSNWSDVCVMCDWTCLAYTHKPRSFLAKYLLNPSAQNHFPYLVDREPLPCTFRFIFLCNSLHTVRDMHSHSTTQPALLKLSLSWINSR